MFRGDPTQTSGLNGVGGLWGSAAQDMSEVYKLLDDGNDGAVSVRKLQHIFKVLEPELTPAEVGRITPHLISRRFPFAEHLLLCGPCDVNS